MTGLKQMGERATRLAEAGEHREAVLIWEAMHRQKPDHAGVSLGLAAALMAAGRFDDAESWLTLCCHRHPDDPALPRLLGRVLARLRKREAAIGAYYHSLSLEPAHGDTHAELASTLYWHRQTAAALPHAIRACEQQITELGLSTLLCVLLELGHKEQALALIDGIGPEASLHPGTLAVYRAGILLELDRLDESLAATREAIRLMPENDAARHQLAAGLLGRGELTAESWALYEGRRGLLAQGDWPAERLRWQDQEVRGRTVLVHAEQGLGDTLQFIRYVPLVAALGARVVVAVQHSLVRLLQGTPGAAEVISAGTLPPFDYYIPLLSLPGKFGTTLETIPAPIRYAGISAQPERTEGRLQVGLVWAGRSEFVDDRKRSIPPSALLPLAQVDADFHSLQFGTTEMPFPAMRDGLQGAADFAETAARIAALDLVVCVDTAVAHLAATMGKPVWLMSRYNGCWRWLQEREDSPWYPSLRLFRQPSFGDWTSVIERVRCELNDWATRRTMRLDEAPVAPDAWSATARHDACVEVAAG